MQDIFAGLVNICINMLMFCSQFSLIIFLFLMKAPTVNSTQLTDPKTIQNLGLGRGKNISVYSEE